MTFIRHAGLVTTMFAIAACSSDPSTATTHQNVGTESVATDQATYSPGQDVTVTFTNISGAASDWIALAKPSDPPTTYAAWAYTGGGTAGTVLFTAPALAAGTYEARMYYDWDGTQSFTVAATSPSFTVGSAVTTSSATYSVGQPVVLDYVGLPGNQTDWVAIAPQGSPNTSFAAWLYVYGATSGEVSFADPPWSIPPGTYVARAFTNDSYTLAAESSPFTVGGGVTVTTDKSPYSLSDNIMVTYSGLTTNPTNWITVAVAGSPTSSFGEWHYTGGTSAGTIQFAPLTAGQYEARAFFNDGFTLAGSVPFTVSGPPAVSTDPSYSAGQTVTLTYSGLPGNATDWVAVSPAGSAATSYTAWAYTNGQAAGTQAFANLAAGDYEARAYSNDSFTMIASSVFTITNNASISTDLQSYAAADPVNVSYDGLPGNTDDWISISVAGSPDDSFVSWVYTNGAHTGTAQFTGLPAGTYEARSYLHDTFVVAARSAQFSVAP